MGLYSRVRWKNIKREIIIDVPHPSSHLPQYPQARAWYPPAMQNRTVTALFITSPGYALLATGALPKWTGGGLRQRDLLSAVATEDRRWGIGIIFPCPLGNI